MTKGKQLIIPPATPGSLGDAAMISATVRFLRQQEAESVALVYGKRWELDEKIDRRIAAERFFYKGSPIQRSLLFSRIQKISGIFLIGADIIDGSYSPLSVQRRLTLLDRAARLGKKATILGASYSKSPEKGARDTLRSLPENVVICARDPISYKRMEESLDRPIRQTADVAFLARSYPEHPIAQKASEWISARKKAGDEVFALNANYLHFSKDNTVQNALTEVLKTLMRDARSVLLIPHDVRFNQPDQKLLETIANSLSPSYKERIYMLPPESPGAIKAALSEVDFLITGRMHAAILALGTGTPAFCFTYQDKFEGLYSLFGLQDADLLSAPEELATNPAQVSLKIIEAIKRREDLRKKVNQHLPGIVELARANFK
ncbi:MAG TPA: hypothetical protein DEA55_05240 [Rhodospirillaceae bacterium]|nr:hypothetical protein [Rhodospirillaceae bacterium]